MGDNEIELEEKGTTEILDDIDIVSENKSVELSRVGDRLRPYLLFGTSLFIAYFWDLVFIVLQFVLFDWEIVPIFFAILNSILFFISIGLCYQFKSMAPLLYCILKFLINIAIAAIWSYKIIDWVENQQEPGWVNEYDKHLSPTLALGLAIMIFIVWYAIALALIFEMLFAHYSPNVPFLLLAGGYKKFKNPAKEELFDPSENDNL